MQQRYLKSIVLLAFLTASCGEGDLVTSDGDPAEPNIFDRSHRPPPDESRPGDPGPTPDPEPDPDPTPSPSCEPATCASLGLACGLADDGCTGSLDCGACPEVGQSWCDAQTWVSGVPDGTSKVTIAAGQTVLLDCDARAQSVEVLAGGSLVFSRQQAAKLTLTGNLVIRGTVDIGTPDNRVREMSEIVFEDVDDTKFVGTEGSGAYVISDSDVGIWVVDDGALLAAGASKRAWSFLVDGAAPGDDSIEVEDASGWLPGDTVILTPTAPVATANHYQQYDELTIRSVTGNQVTLDGTIAFEHSGCPPGTCYRRGEAVNLTRNAVIRSADDSGHAHIFVADDATVGLDSVELAYLGPAAKPCTSNSSPARRAALWFHRQEDGARQSYVRHTSIWGGDNLFLMNDQSHGLEVLDVAGYDGWGGGIHQAMTDGAEDRNDGARDSLMRDVLSAKVSIPTSNKASCAPNYNVYGIRLTGGAGSGCINCVSSGVGFEGSGPDAAGVARPSVQGAIEENYTTEKIISHNNRGHGMFLWFNATPRNEFEDIALWSNEKHGLRWGAYGNSFLFDDLRSFDNGLNALSLKAVPKVDGEPRIDGALIDDLMIESYNVVQEEPQIFMDLHYTGTRPVAFSQVHDSCSGGNEMDLLDDKCKAVLLLIVDPVFPAGVMPFDFGNTFNFHSNWEVQGFVHPDAKYANYPSDFTLYRADNEQPGGCYEPDFDAWMVPCP